MLTLNTLSDTSAPQRVSGPDKPKLRAAEDKHAHADFESYMAALSQPMRTEQATKQQTVPTETGSAARSVEERESKPKQQTDTIYDSAPQKAGHEKDAKDKDTAAMPLKERETQEARPVANRSVRADKELLETLGLNIKGLTDKKAMATATGMTKPQAAQTTALTSTTGKVNKGGLENVSTTLAMLTKSPDVVLAKADGLKRLGEKLGFAFLGRVGEKVAERNLKQDSTTVSQKINERHEVAMLAAHARVQKAGDGSTQSQSESQSQTKSPRQQAQRVAMRETVAQETSTGLRQHHTENLLVVNSAQQDTQNTRLQHATLQTADLRLSEAAASARTTESMRVAVENPLMRADLVRQFNEIMGRAQVLVTDTQNAQFSVKLFPREIGRMEIDLKMVEGEIRGKIVVESEDVKNEMQNFLQNRDNQHEGKQIDLNRIDIEVRSGNQNANNPQRTPDADELLQNLVTRTAANAYNAPEISTTQGNALYA